VNKFVLIGRLHINGKNHRNSWKSLSKYLDRKIIPIEPTKALIEIRSRKSLSILRQKLRKYNKKYYTDFFIGAR